jgi:hypothetical protein
MNLLHNIFLKPGPGSMTRFRFCLTTALKKTALKKSGKALNPDTPDHRQIIRTVAVCHDVLATVSKRPCTVGRSRFPGHVSPPKIIKVG